jgi:NAD(P) transhydrogenase subunit alpha
MWQRWVLVLWVALAGLGAGGNAVAGAPAGEVAPGGEVVPAAPAHAASDSWALVFVLLLATFVGLGVIMRVSRLLHTPLMSLTNAISAIAVVGAILVAGPDYPWGIRLLGAVAVFAAMTNIVSGFLITDRMLRMFKQTRQEPKP